MEYLIKKVDPETGKTTTTNTETGEVKVEFHIVDDGGANWYLRKKAAFESERAVLNAQMKELFAEIDRNERDLDARYYAEFKDYAEKKILAQGKPRNYKFFYATASLRDVPEHWTVTDAETAIRTAKLICPDALSEFTTVKTVLDKEKLFAKAAEIAKEKPVPGVDLIPQRDSFSIKFPKTDTTTIGPAVLDPSAPRAIEAAASGSDE